MERARRMLAAMAISGLVGGGLVAAQTPPDVGVSQAPGCVGIVMPKVQPSRGNVAETAASLRDMFASYLTGPTLNTVSLESRLTSQAIEEAKQKGCDRVLLVTLTQKGGGRGMGPLGQVIGEAAGTAVYYVPGGGDVGSAAARAAAIAGTHAVTNVARNTRKKDELKLEYRIDTVDGQPFLPLKTEKAKARQDGEDLLTPLVEKASEAVAAAIAVR